MGGGGGVSFEKRGGGEGGGARGRVWDVGHGRGQKHTGRRRRHPPLVHAACVAGGCSTAVPRGPRPAAPRERVGLAPLKVLQLRGQHGGGRVAQRSVQRHGHVGVGAGATDVGGGDEEGVGGDLGQLAAGKGGREGRVCVLLMVWRRAQETGGRGGTSATFTWATRRAVKVAVCMCRGGGVQGRAGPSGGIEPGGDGVRVHACAMLIAFLVRVHMIVCRGGPGTGGGDQWTPACSSSCTPPHTPRPHRARPAAPTALSLTRRPPASSPACRRRCGCQTTCGTGTGTSGQS